MQGLGEVGNVRMGNMWMLAGSSCQKIDYFSCLEVLLRIFPFNIGNEGMKKRKFFG